MKSTAVGIVIVVLVSVATLFCRPLTAQPDGNNTRAISVDSLNKGEPS